MDSLEQTDSPRVGAVRQTAQRFVGVKSQLPPYPLIKQKPKLPPPPSVPLASSAAKARSDIITSTNPTATSGFTMESQNSLQDSLSYGNVSDNLDCKPAHTSLFDPSPINSRLESVELDSSLQLASALRRQLQLRANRQPFVFTMMVVGATGLGKSTFVNQLFSCSLYDLDEHPPHPDLSEPGQTMDIRVRSVRLNERSVQLQLNLVDTPGFGDLLDNGQACDRVLRFVEIQLEKHLQAETQLCSHRSADQRVHCCLYFLQPGGHIALRPLDVHFMKALHHRLNLVPVIAKADTLTPNELASFKQTVSFNFSIFQKK